MNEQKYNVYVTDGVNATVIIKAKENLIHPFNAVAECPSKHCKMDFDSSDEDAKVAKDKIIFKIKNHWIKDHRSKNGKRKFGKKEFKF